MPAQALLRPETDEEVDAVVGLWAAAYERAPAAPSASHVHRLLAHDPGAVIVATYGRSLVGSVIASWDGWRGNLYRLAVHPDHRRHGLALRLVRAGAEHLRDQGAERISALLQDDDPAARALWTAAGFTPQPGTARFVRDLQRDRKPPTPRAAGSTSGWASPAPPSRATRCG